MADEGIPGRHDMNDDAKALKELLVEETILTMVEHGELYDTGKRRGGEIVWALTEWGKAVYAMQDLEK